MIERKKQDAAAPIRAAIYARYSSHNQNEQSIEGQLHDAYAYAERLGYEVITEYIDRAKSGKYDERASFQRMIADAEKKQFSVVLVWKLDRFARNRYDSAIYKAKLKKYDIRVISVMERIEDNPEGIILEGMLESMAEYYSANLSVNIKRGQRETIAKGKFCGGHIPFGYRSVDGHLVADERTAPIAQEIFRRYASGDGMKEIVTDLNRRGIRTNTGAAFTVNTFSRALKNRAYIGEFTYGGQVIPGLSESIIDRETFDKVQLTIIAHKHTPAAATAKVEYQLQGKLFCGHCGAPMVGESGRSKGGAIYHYYACAIKKKDHACNKHNEKKDFVEWYVVEQTMTYILDPDRAHAIAQAVVAEYDKEFGADTVKANERRIARIDNELNALVDRLADAPAAAVPRIYAKMDALENEKAELEADTARLRVAQSLHYTVPQVEAWLRSFGSGDPTDEAYRRKIIDTLINAVYLYDDRIVLFFNIRGGKQVSYFDLQSAYQDALSGDFTSDSQESVRTSMHSLHQTQSSPNTLQIIMINGVPGLMLKRALAD